MIDDENAPGAPLPFTGERFVPGEGGAELAAEHIHRYLAARPYVVAKDVVDLGSGSGYAAVLLEGCRSYLGFDIDQESVAHAQNRYGGATTRFRVGDVTAVDHPESTADVVLSFEVLEHVAEPASVVAEASRLLRPGGVLISSTPDRTAYNQGRAEPNPFHVAEMERDEFEQLLTKNFAHVRMYAQRWAPASWMIGADSEGTVRIVETGVHGLGGTPTAVYWVAVASDDANALDLGSSVLVSSSDGSNELERAVQQLRAYESELEAVRAALTAADAREINARAQLLAYEGQIDELTGALESLTATARPDGRPADSADDGHAG